MLSALPTHEHAASYRNRLENTLRQQNKATWRRHSTVQQKWDPTRRQRGVPVTRAVGQRRMPRRACHDTFVTVHYLTASPCLARQKNWKIAGPLALLPSRLYHSAYLPQSCSVYCYSDLYSRLISSPLLPPRLTGKLLYAQALHQSAISRCPVWRRCAPYTGLSGSISVIVSESS